MGRRLKTDPKLAYALIRVSTEEQANGPAAQRDAIQRFADAQGIRVVEWVEELGVSGAAPADGGRGALFGALTAMKANRIGCLLVAKRDRLARDQLVYTTVEHLLRLQNARLLSADGNNEDTPEAELLRSILVAVAVYERRIIGDRTKRALAARKVRGQVTSSTTPYGFAAVDGKVVPNPAEVSVIEEIRRLRADGMKIEAIAATLNGDRGRFPPRGKRWHATSVARILGGS